MSSATEEAEIQVAVAQDRYEHARRMGVGASVAEAYERLRAARERLAAARTASDPGYTAALSRARRKLETLDRAASGMGSEDVAVWVGTHLDVIEALILREVRRSRVPVRSFETHDLTWDVVDKVIRIGSSRPRPASKTFDAWVRELVQRETRGLIRENDRRLQRETPGGLAAELPDEPIEPHELPALRWSREVVQQCTDDEWTLLIFRGVYNLSTQEIAEIVGVPVTTVHARMRQVRSKLRQLLAEQHEHDLADD